MLRFPRFPVLLLAALPLAASDTPDPASVTGDTYPRHA